MLGYLGIIILDDLQQRLNWPKHSQVLGGSSQLVPVVRSFKKTKPITMVMIPAYPSPGIQSSKWNNSQEPKLWNKFTLNYWSFYHLRVSKFATGCLEDEFPFGAQPIFRGRTCCWSYGGLPSLRLPEAKSPHKFVERMPKSKLLASVCHCLLNTKNK